MLIKTEILQDLSNKIISAVDISAFSEITEVLRLEAKNKMLTLSVTNKEYYATVKLPMETDEELVATVNANIFLKLVSATTSESIELNVAEGNLCVRGNGTYKIPVIYDGDKVLELPKIELENVTSSFDVETSILLSILNYNSKEITKGSITRPVQKLYYVDGNGCLTFTSGACVNKFNLEKGVKILLNDRLVKLFKLFRTEKVKFELAYDELSTDVVQTKVKFYNDNVEISAILSCDDALINSVPVEAIRGRADKEYDNSILVNRVELLDAIKRILIFNPKTSNPYSSFAFGSKSFTIFGQTNDIKETLNFDGTVMEGYSCVLDLEDLRLTLEGCAESHITMKFGDNQAFVIVRNNVYNVIPEVRG